MRARVSCQLTKQQHTVSRSVSKFLGADSSVRHRQPQFIEVQPKSTIERFVDSVPFHMVCGLAVVSNAVFVGVLAEFRMMDASRLPPRDDPWWFPLVNRIYVGIFLLELLLRLAGKRLAFLLGEESKWNLFDVVLACTSILEEVFQCFSFTYVRLLRGFRMVRVLRVIRVMRFFRELRLMVCSVLQSLVSLSWALVLLMLITYLFTVCFMHAASEYLVAGGDLDVREPLLEYYGSVGCTMYTLLLSISGGADWMTFVEPLSRISVFYQVIFCFYVLFIVIGVLNVLTSAFVQRACELSRLDRDLVIQSEMVANESFLAEMKGIFEEVDTEGSGCISWDQFREFIQNEQVQAYFQTQQLDTSDARELFNLLDMDQDGEVCIEEFIMGCKKLRGQAKSVDVASLLREHKRSNHKHLRAMKRLEAQINNMCSEFLGLGLALSDGVSGLPWSPSSATSQPSSCSPRRTTIRAARCRSKGDGSESDAASQKLQKTQV